MEEKYPDESEHLEAINTRIEVLEGINKHAHEALKMYIAFIETSTKAKNQSLEHQIKKLEERIEKLGG